MSLWYETSAPQAFSIFMLFKISFDHKKFFKLWQYTEENTLTLEPEISPEVDPKNKMPIRKLCHEYPVTSLFSNKNRFPKPEQGFSNCDFLVHTSNLLYGCMICLLE
jgi:hypothetical protein